jgi:hypothetical protein
MERALTFAGYQVRHVWGSGGHNGKQATAVFPDAMRWLWQDWPQPVRAGTSQNLFLQAILPPGSQWQLAADGQPQATVLTSDRRGDVIFRSGTTGQLRRLAGDGTVSPFPVDARAGPLAFGSNGSWYAADSTGTRIIDHTTDGRTLTVAAGVRVRGLIVTGNDFYATEDETLWLIHPGGEKIKLDHGLKQATGVALSPDGLWLAVAEHGSQRGYSYRVERDGKVSNKEPFYWFHVPDGATDSGASAWCMDRDGRLYAATRLGVQVFDRNGRVRCILPVPGGAVTGLCFGGPNLETLYVSAADRIYRRSLRVAGWPAWAPTHKLPPWGGG